MRRFAAIGAASALLVTAMAMSPGKTAAAQAGGWQFNADTGHWYILASMGWSDAEAFAEANGGHLVTVNDSKEQNWLHSTFPGESLAIGFTDGLEEGSWVWASGEAVTYMNWCDGEPNDANQGEDVAAMNWQPSGCWNDLPNAGLAVLEAVEPFALPMTLSIQAEASHYLGGDWEHQIGLTVNCEGYDPQVVPMDFPGMSDVYLGDVGVGTSCSIEVSYWPDAGENAGWDEPIFWPGSDVVLGEGANLVTVNVPRVWGGEIGWPPHDDEFIWHDMQLTVNKVNLNAKGGIEVEGTAWCPDAAEVLTGAFKDVDVYHNTQWTALQYVGRRTAIHASYDSAIADLCWQGSSPTPGPFGWKTRLPNGAVQFVYGWDGKFANGTIHVEGHASAETEVVSQNFDPSGFYPFEGGFVPYDAACVDNNGDGWCVAHHQWEGFAQGDLRTTRVK